MRFPRFLLVTEKHRPDPSQRDGGARLVETLQRCLGEQLQILQFGPQDYPHHDPCRFKRRLANGRFIAEEVKQLEGEFTHFLFVHISMQFGLVDLSLREGAQVWTFPMFLTPSYRASGEEVPAAYAEQEEKALALSQQIVTPSYLEKSQLINHYRVSPDRIHVIPRGVDRSLLQHEVRTGVESPIFCSVGSIKRQKNTLDLVRLFHRLSERYPTSRLRLIGPVQDRGYATSVSTEIERLGLAESIELVGHVPPDRLSAALAGCHLHLSTSSCETFGRAIFETLASGLPSVAMAKENAAARFLHALPYARFVDDSSDAVRAVDELLCQLQTYSKMASEVGELYCDQFLSQRLAAKICDRETIGVSDYDGTLFHKLSEQETCRSIEAFASFPNRIVCSARSFEDLLERLDQHQLTIDWIVAYGGAVVADGNGRVLWTTPLSPADIEHLRGEIPSAEPIVFQGQTLQLACPADRVPQGLPYRVETYQGQSYVAHWQASKLRAVHRLLRHCKWQGQVEAFGDGVYDLELLNFFDGAPSLVQHSNKEKTDVPVTL